jgi:hypothetical protein
MMSSAAVKLRPLVSRLLALGFVLGCRCRASLASLRSISKSR